MIFIYLYINNEFNAPMIVILVNYLIDNDIVTVVCKYNKYRNVFYVIKYHNIAQFLFCNNVNYILVLYEFFT